MQAARLAAARAGRRGRPPRFPPPHRAPLVVRHRRAEACRSSNRGRHGWPAISPRQPRATSAARSVVGRAHARSAGYPSIPPTPHRGTRARNWCGIGALARPSVHSSRRSQTARPRARPTAMSLRSLAASASRLPVYRSARRHRSFPRP
jgi:hypothetical protein